MQNTFTPYKDKYLSKFQKQKEKETSERLSQLEKQMLQLNNAYANQQIQQSTFNQAQTYEEENPKEFLPSIVALPLKGFKGILKGLEGIADAAVTLAAAPGAIGSKLGINTDDQWARDFVSKDLTQEAIGIFSGAVSSQIDGVPQDTIDDIYHRSWWDNSTVGNWVGEAAQGVGGMLPSIAMNAILPGSGLATMGVQAGGNAVEEALNLNPDISLGQATAYGTLSGLTEAATEKMFDAFKIFGGGYADKLINKFSKSQFLRISSGLIGEGIEEVVSDLVNPLSKRITGVDPNAEAPTASELLDSFVVGTMTSAIMGTAQVVMQGGPRGYLANENINAILENRQDIIQQYDKVLKDSLTAEEYTSLKNDTIKHNQMLQDMISEYNNGTLDTSTASKKKLADLMDLNNKLVSKMDEAFARYQATHTEEQTNKFLDKKTSYRDINNEKISRGLMMEDARTIAQPLTLEQKQGLIERNNLQYKYNYETAKYRPEYQNLPKQSQVDLDKMVNNVNKLTEGRIKVAVDYDNKIIKSSDNAFFDPDGKTIVLNANNINNTDVTKNVTMHELNHYLEGTKNGKKLQNYIIDKLKQSDIESYQKQFETKKALYDNASDEFINEEIAGDWLAKNVFTSQKSVEDIVNNNKSLGKSILDWFNKKIDYMSKTKVEKAQYKILEKAQSLFENAIQEANKFDSISKKVRYSIKSDSKGNYVEIDISEVFKNLVDSKGNALTEQEYSNLSNNEKRNIIVRYLQKKFLNKQFTLPNGIEAIITKSDIRKLTNITFAEKTAALTNVEDLLKTASFLGEENVNHKKFSKFYYFDVRYKISNSNNTSINNEMFHATLNVGEIINSKGENRIYEINKIKKDGQVGLAALEGQGHLNTSSDNRISQNQENSQEKNKKIRFSKDETITETKLKAELNQEKVYSYKETSKMVDDFIHTFTSSNNAYIKGGKNTVVKDFFTELNKGNVDSNKLANDLANNMLSNLKIDNTDLTADYKVLMLDELVPQIQAMLKNGGKTATVESLNNYYKDRINYLNSRVKYYRNVSAESNKVFNRIESLKRMTSKDYKYNPNAKHIADSMNNLTKVLKRVNKSADVGRADIRNLIAEYGNYYKFDTKNPDAPLNDYISSEIVDSINYIADRAKDPVFKKTRLSLEELTMVKNIASNALKMINDFDRATIGNQKVYISEYATTANEEINRYTKQFGEGTINKVIRSLEKPFEIIRELEGSIGDNEGNLTKLIVKPMQQSDLQYKQDSLALRKGIDEFNKEHKGYSRKRLVKATIDVQGNNLTIGEAIYLTMLAKRPQAQSHFMIDINENAKGIQLFDQQGRKTNIIKLTTEDINAIESKLTDTDKAYRTMAENIFNNLAKEIKINTDNRYLGYTNIIEDYYVPIQTSDDTRWKNYGDARQYNSIDSLFGLYFNQATIEGASNTIRLNNLNDVLDKHIDLISKYDAYVETVKNIQRTLNTKVEYKGETTTLRNEISKKWKDFDKYLNGILMSQVNVNYQTNGFSKAMSKIRSAWAKSVLGLNIKSWVNQLTGIPTAAAIIDYNSLVKGSFMKNTVETRAEMDKYTNGYTEYRNYDREVFKNEANVSYVVNMAGDVLTKPMSSIDRVSIGTLWNSCQVEIQSKNGYKIGTEQNKVKAGELLNEVLRRTQEASTAIDKPSISRTNSELLKGALMFTNQSMQCLSLLTSSAKELLRVKRVIKAEGSNELNQKALKQARTKVAKAATSVAISNLLAALVGTIFTKFLGKDDEKETFLQQLTGNFAEQSIGMVPIARDIYGKFVSGYDITDSSFNMINQLFDSSKTLFDNAVNGKLQTKDINKFVQNFAALFGLPLRNAENYVYGILNVFAPEIALKYKNLFFGVNTTQQYSVLEDAIKDNDIDLATGALDLIMDSSKLVSIESNAVNKQIVSLIGKGFKNVLPKTISSNTIVYDAEEYELKGSNKQKFISNYNKVNSDLNALVNMSIFKNMSDEEKADTIKYLFDYYYYFALNKTFSIDISNNKVYNNAELVKPLYSSIYLSKKKNSLKGNKQALNKLVSSMFEISPSQKQALLNM